MSVRATLRVVGWAILLIGTQGCTSPSADRESAVAADSTEDRARSVITGTVEAPDGSVSSPAHVSVRLHDRQPLQSTAVGSDGRFQMALDTAGVADLTVRGLHRAPATVETYLTRGDTTTLQVDLASAALQDTLKEAHVIGPFNDFDPRSGVDLQRQADGTYRATVPASGDSLAYQVAGVRDDDWLPVGGTQATRYAYQGRRGYRSVVPAPGDSVTVSFAPDQLPQRRAASQIAFADTTSPAARYHRFTASLEQRYDAYLERLQSDRSSADTIEWAANHRQVRTKLKQDVPASLQHAYLAAYLEHTPDVDTALARRALETLPADSPLWATGRALPYRTAAAAGALDRYRPFFYDLLAENPSQDVKAGLLYQLLRRAKEAGNEDRQRLLYTWLTSEYPDTRRAESARKRYNPDRRIQPGKPVPRFEVAALEGSRTFTPDDFEGRYVLIDFWATWCKPCIAEFPTLRKAYRGYDRDTFTILSVALDPQKETVTTFVEGRDLPWRHAYSSGNFESPMAEQFEVGALPKPVLVGPDGQIIETRNALRGERLLNVLRREIGRPAARQASSETSTSPAR
jgi:thiol-disulfide isomerase/thioredoxin